jgi:hypothetical protein
MERERREEREGESGEQDSLAESFESNNIMGLYV